jgi:hypothetical protein
MRFRQLRGRKTHQAVVSYLMLFHPKSFAAWNKLMNQGAKEVISCGFYQRLEAVEKKMIH